MNFSETTTKIPVKSICPLFLSTYFPYPLRSVVGAVAGSTAKRIRDAD